MCELNLVTLHCVTVKLLSILLVTFVTFHTLQTVPSDLSPDASALRSIYFIQSGGKLVFRKTRL